MARPPFSHAGRRRASSSSEGAFTIVEVIIAVLLLTAVIAGIALAAAGGSRLQGAAKLQAAITSAGQQMQEDLSTNRKWMSSCAAPACDVQTSIDPASARLRGIDGGIVTYTASAKPVDSDVDGVEGGGTHDEDGVVPDYYTLEIVITVPDTVAERYSLPEGMRTRKVVTSIDRRGQVQLGSLAVDACKVVNQSDERMTIEGCPRGSGALDLKMQGCPPQARWGCWNAWNWVDNMGAADGGTPSPFVRIRHVPPSSYSFTLRSVADPSKTWASGGAKVVDGMYVFENLDAGEYELTGLPNSDGPEYERWKTKEVPAYLNGAKLVVEPGMRNRALMVFRPKRTNTGIDLHFKRVIHIHKIQTMHTSTEVTAPRWTETDEYIGFNGAAECAKLDAMFNGQGHQYSVTNCREIPSNRANCVTIAYDWSSDMEGTSGTYDNDWCTFFTEWYDHQYYKQDAYEEDTINGAMETATYAVAPRPDIRIAEPDGAGGNVMPWSYCYVRGHNDVSGGGTGQCETTIDNLWPGLNTSVSTSDALLQGADNSNHAFKNQDISGTPDWMTSGGLWVPPGGGLIGPNGPINPPSATLIGDGECYWKSPEFTGRKEGACQPCNPTFDTGTLTGACSILTKSCWTREVIEREVGQFGEEYPLAGAGDCDNWGTALPFKCSGFVPHMSDGECVRATPPPDIPDTFHPTGTGGTTKVKSHNYGSKPTKQ